MSSASDRLEIVYGSYSSAYGRRADDLKSAATTREAQAILDNVDSLEASYLQAAKDALDATGAEVEAAYADASDARAKVEDAYQQARALADKINAVAQCASSVASLVQKAAT